MTTVRLLIKGKVQGVFFRATAKEIAQALDLKGWVKNTADGHVEALVTGDEEGVQQFIEWSKRGPENAVVSSVSVETLAEKRFDDFRVIRG